MRVGFRWGLSLGLVAIAAGYLIWTASGSTADYYRTVAEVQRDRSGPGEARVLGTVQDDVQRLDGGLELRFTAVQDGATMPVDYRGTVPDIFQPGIQVVVEGRFGSDGVFHARTLLAKCPSRFTARTP